MNPIKVVGNTIEVEAASLYGDFGVPHSVMISNNSLWSAGQRRFALKNKRIAVSYVKVTASISWPMILRIHETYLQMKDIHSRKAKKQREERGAKFDISYLE